MIRSINKTLLSLVVLLVLTGNLLAQPQAVIVGPTETPPGEMVVLSSKGSVGDNLEWIKPEGLQTLSVGCSLLDTQVVFATTKVGKYEFWLIVADKEAKISYKRHVVEVKGKSPPVDDPPIDEPDDPVPPNPTKWSNLSTISKSGADKLNDNDTRSKLKSRVSATVMQLESLCAAGTCPTLDAAKDSVRKTIEAVLLTRVGPSAQIDWTLWRRGNQAEIDKLGLVDVKDYIAAVKAIYGGL